MQYSVDLHSGGFHSGSPGLRQLRLTFGEKSESRCHACHSNRNVVYQYDSTQDGGESIVLN